MTGDVSTATPHVVMLEEVFGDTSRLGELFAANGPYWNQGRYLSAAGAASQMPSGAASTVGVPWYREDWAIGGTALVDGAAALLAHEGFAAAAREVFGGEVVRPHTVYANVQVPAPATDAGHTDVPEFRGFTRDRYPVALLHLMNRSGLFGPWQLDICTAVTWQWEGPGGEFLLWDRGPDETPERYGPPLTNRAVVSDNDRLYHGIGDFSRPDGPRPEDLTPASEAVPVPGGWELRDGDRVVGTWTSPAVRLSVSWKAYVFADATAARVYDEHLDDLDEATVLEIFAAELAARGRPLDGVERIDDRLLLALAAEWPKKLPAPG